MTKIVAETKTVNMQCEKCGRGVMKACGNVVCYLTMPPVYPHKCTVCGYTKNYRVAYPYQTTMLKEPFRMPSKEEMDILKGENGDED